MVKGIRLGPPTALLRAKRGQVRCGTRHVRIDMHLAPTRPCRLQHIRPIGRRAPASVGRHTRTECARRLSCSPLRRAGILHGSPTLRVAQPDARDAHRSPTRRGEGVHPACVAPSPCRHNAQREATRDALVTCYTPKAVWTRLARGPPRPARAAWDAPASASTRTAIAATASRCPASF